MVQPKESRKQVLIVVFVLLVVFEAVYLICVRSLYCVQEYVPGTGNIKGEVDVEEFERLGSEFEIGANAYGYAVFKRPKQAFQKLKKDYSAGIALIQKEYDLPALSEENYDVYGTYGWQVTTGTEKEQVQADFVSSFVDIYENCYQLS